MPHNRSAYGIYRILDRNGKHELVDTRNTISDAVREKERLEQTERKAFTVYPIFQSQQIMLNSKPMEEERR